MTHMWTLLDSASYLHVIRIASPSSLVFLQPHEAQAHVCMRCAGYGPSTTGFQVTACQLQRKSPDLFLTHVPTSASQLIQSFLPATPTQSSLDDAKFAVLLSGLRLEYAQSMRSCCHCCLGWDLKCCLELARCILPEPCTYHRQEKVCMEHCLLR